MLLRRRDYSNLPFDTSIYALIMLLRQRDGRRASKK